MSINQQRKNHIIILIIFGMSIVPVMLAWVFLHFAPVKLTNKGELITPVVPTVIPSEVASGVSDYRGYDAYSTENLNELKGHWLIANVIPTEHCNEVCLKAMVLTKQLRIMLNRDLPRTRRIALVFKDPNPDQAAQWWLKDTLLWMLETTRGKSDEAKKADAALYNKLLSEENKVDAAVVRKLLDPENKLDDTLITDLMVQKDSQLAKKSDLIRIKPSASMMSKLTALRKGDIPDGMLFLIDPQGNVMMQYEPGFDPYKVKNDLMQLLRASQIG